MTPNSQNKLLKLSILWGAFFVFGIHAHSQTDSIISVNNTESEKIIRLDEDINDVDNVDTLKHRFDFSEKNPRIATLSSAILPGLGQAYNGKYYKIPIIYGAGFIFYYYYDYNKYEWNRIKIARKELKETGIISDPQLARYEDPTLERYQNSYQRYRDYNLLFLILLYTANVVDAMVDSYMVEFDVSDDLSLQVAPSLMTNPTIYNSSSAGVKLSFRF